jgi:hypothetical protein
MNVTLRGASAVQVPSSLAMGDGANSVQPVPTNPTMEDTLTAMELLLAMQSRLQMEHLNSGVQIISAERSVARDLREQERLALERQRQAAGDASTGLIGSLADWVEDVADDLVHFRVADAATDSWEHIVSIVDNPHFWRDLKLGAATVSRWFARAGAVAASAALIAGGSVSGGALTVVGVVALSAVLTGSVITETRLGGRTGAHVGLGLELGGSVASGAGLLAAPAGLNLAATTTVSVTRTGAGASEALRAAVTIRTVDFEHDATIAGLRAQSVAAQAERHARRSTSGAEWARSAAESDARAVQLMGDVLQAYLSSGATAQGVRA